MKRVFDRVYVGLLLCSVLAAGCINVGSRFDMRKYPTPIAPPGAKPVQHIWCPDEPASTFNGPALPTGLNHPQQPSALPQPMPKGPPMPTTQTSLGSPSWNDPH